MAGLRNVLLLEDDAMIRELYRIALVDGQYSVEISSNADDFFKKLENFHPDVILLDVMLPGTSGLEVLKKLRTDPSYGCLTTKIVILTNLADQSVTDKALESGADGYVIKTDILPNDLLKIIPSLEDSSEGTRLEAPPAGE